MLKQKLEALPFSSNDPIKKKEFYRQAIKYTLNVTDSKTLNNAARTVGVFAEVKDLKHKFLKGSPYTLSKLWKAVISSGEANTSNGQTDYSHIATKYGVASEDLIFIKEILNEKDLKKVKKKYSQRDIKKQKFSFEEAYGELHDWTNRLVRKKFNFILKIYPDLESSDLVQELLFQGYLRALECDTISTRLYFINTIKRRIKQRSINLIKYFTAESRLKKQLDKKDRARPSKFDHRSVKVQTAATEWEFALE